jgi:hypothetical protein
VGTSLFEKAIVLIDRTGDLPKESGLGRSRSQGFVAIEQVVKICRRGNIVQRREVIMLETMPSKHWLTGKHTGPGECGWNIWLYSAFTTRPSTSTIYAFTQRVGRETYVVLVRDHPDQ